MTTIRLPGLVDVHVHMREPGAEHKEIWETGTAAALAGGIGTVLAMPNTSPAIVDEASLDLALQAASTGARCDFGHYVGAGPGNAAAVASLEDPDGSSLRDAETDVLVSYLPVGSDDATKFYAQAALDTGAAFVNAIPVFIAS